MLLLSSNLCDFVSKMSEVFYLFMSTFFVEWDLEIVDFAMPDWFSYFDTGSPRVYSFSMVSFPPGPSSAMTARPLLALIIIFSAFYRIIGSILISLYTEDIVETWLLVSKFPPTEAFAFCDALWGICKIQKPWSYLTGVPSGWTSLLTWMRARASVYLIWVPLI